MNPLSDLEDNDVYESVDSTEVYIDHISEEGEDFNMGCIEDSDKKEVEISSEKMVIEKVGDIFLFEIVIVVFCVKYLNHV